MYEELNGLYKSIRLLSSTIVWSSNDGSSRRRFNSSYALYVDECKGPLQEVRRGKGDEVLHRV